MYKLIIFDADGTLIDRDSGEFLPNVLETISNLSPDTGKAIATNQGGPACRDAGWPWSDKYPTLIQVEEKYQAIADKIGATLYMSLAYKLKNGKYIVPNGLHLEDLRGSPNYRKPNPGMINYASQDFRMEKSEILMVGDSEDDENAALAAGVDFQWASEFFGWGIKSLG